MTTDEPIDYNSVIYAIDHILLAYMNDVTPNLRVKLNKWKNNIKEELRKWQQTH